MGVESRPLRWRTRSESPGAFRGENRDVLHHPTSIPALFPVIYVPVASTRFLARRDSRIFLGRRNGNGVRIHGTPATSAKVTIKAATSGFISARERCRRRCASQPDACCSSPRAAWFNSSALLFLPTGTFAQFHCTVLRVVLFFSLFSRTLKNVDGFWNFFNPTVRSRGTDCFRRIEARGYSFFKKQFRGKVFPKR